MGAQRRALATATFMVNAACFSKRRPRYLAGMALCAWTTNKQNSCGVCGGRGQGQGASAAGSGQIKPRHSKGSSPVETARWWARHGSPGILQHPSCGSRPRHHHPHQISPPHPQLSQCSSRSTASHQTPALHALPSLRELRYLLQTTTVSGRQTSAAAASTSSNPRWGAAAAAAGEEATADPRCRHKWSRRGSRAPHSL